MNLNAALPYPELWHPERAALALSAPEIKPLKIPGTTLDPYDIQSRGIAWLHSTPRSILGDVTGTGKAPHGIGLMALCAAQGELQAGPMVFVTLAPTVVQHLEEFARFWPSARLVTNKGMNKAARLDLYRRRDWDVLVTSYDLAWRDGPEMAALMHPAVLWLDESSRAANRDSRTFAGVKALTLASRRIHEANATPLENDLLEVHTQLDLLGLAGTSETPFGNEFQFKNRYCIYQTERIRARGGRMVTRETLMAYRHLDEFVERFRPFYLRRTEGSADMPDVAPPEDVWLEMNPRQRQVYNEAVGGRLNGHEIDGSARLTYLLQITAGLSTVGQDDDSSKLDWLMEFLTKRVPNDKVVVFSRWLPTIPALKARLAAVGIGCGVISGNTSKDRDAIRRAFWEDPNMRVCIVTTAGERGLNLQIAKYVVCIDLMWNPARIEQLLGRVKRSGSPHKTVFLIRLMTTGTVEEGLVRVNRTKATLADFVNEEEAHIWEALSETERAVLLRGVA